MAHWTRSEDDSRIMLDNGAGHLFIAYKHAGHLHAEEILPWADDGQGRQTPEEVAQSFLDSRLAAGDTTS